MEKNQTTTELYQQGFNEGYLISEHYPELGESLSIAVTGSLRSEGFKDGHEQMVLDARNRRPSWLRDDWRSSDNNRDMHKENDKEDYDIER